MPWAEKHGLGYRGVYRDLKSKRHKTTVYTTRRVALQAAQDQEFRIREGTWIDPSLGKMTLAEYFEVWMTDRVAELNTQQGWRAHWHAERFGIARSFGDMRPRQILTSDIQSWVTRMVADGMSRSTIEGRFVTLQTILVARRGPSALRDGLLMRNPCEGVQTPVRPKRSVRIFELAEVDALLDYLDPWWVPIPMLDSETGLRWGELMGLEVRDFAHGYRSVRVERVVLELPKSQTGNGTRFLTKGYAKEGPRANPKSVALSDAAQALVSSLVDGRHLASGDRLFSMPDRTPPADWRTPMALHWRPRRTETWPGGLPISRNYFRQSVWKPAIAASGVPDLQFHALRASHISWLLSGGAALPDVMERVGHRQFSTTRRYTAVLGDSDRRLLEALSLTKSRARRMT